MVKSDFTPTSIEQELKKNSQKLDYTENDLGILLSKWDEVAHNLKNTELFLMDLHELYDDEAITGSIENAHTQIKNSLFLLNSELNEVFSHFEKRKSRLEYNEDFLLKKRKAHFVINKTETGGAYDKLY